MLAEPRRTLRRRLGSLATAALVAAFVALSAAAAAIAVPRWFDLDVAIPPGSPLDWSRSIPVTGSGGGSVFTAPRRPVSEGTRVSPSTAQLPVRLPAGSDLLRILTVDLTFEIPWVAEHEFPRATFVLTGAKRPADLPPIGRAAYWAALAPLLRMQLHPSQVSTAETLAHLLEIGEAAIPAIEAAMSEKALAGDCKWLLDQIGDASPIAPKVLLGPTPEARLGSTPEAAMLQRFVVDELTAGHPFDPTSEFGRRLLWFGDAFASAVASYTNHPHPFLRRNAVFLLGRLEGTTATNALLETATGSRDPVARIRAISAISRRKRSVDAQRLADALPRAGSDAEWVALVHALGSLGDARTAVAIRKSLGGRLDSDLLLAALSALAQIPVSDADEAQWKWLQGVSVNLRGDPSRFRVERAGVKADIPDTSDLRARMLRQLCLLALARTKPFDRDLAKEVVELASEPAAGAAGRGRGMYANPSLGGVFPVAQFVYLDLLRSLGEPGHAVLRAVAKDELTDPALRGHALLRLQENEQGNLARALFADPKTPHGLRVHALELLDFVENPAAPVLARDHLDSSRFFELPLPGDPEERTLALSALRIAGKHRRLRAEEMEKHTETLRRPPPRVPDPEVVLRTLAEAVVDSAEKREPRDAQKEAMKRFVQEATKNLPNPGIWTEPRANLARELEKLLVGLASSSSGPRYRALVIESLLSAARPVVAGRTADPNQLDFRGRVLLEEALLLELGRTESAAGARWLASIASPQDSERPASLRAVACLALGVTRRADALPALLPRLSDPDPFVRYCAYAALRHGTEQDFAADWIYGTPAERREASNLYQRWLMDRR